MPSMIGPYDPPFDPWNCPPTRLVLPAALIRRPTVLLAKSARPASTSAAGLSASSSSDMAAAG